MNELNVKRPLNGTTETRLAQATTSYQPKYLTLCFFFILLNFSSFSRELSMMSQVTSVVGEQKTKVPMKIEAMQFEGMDDFMDCAFFFRLSLRSVAGM